MSQAFRLFPVTAFSKPFRYAVSPQALDSELSCSALAWLETYSSWSLAETDFYEQYEFSLLNAKVPAALACLRAKDFLEGVKGRMEELFEVRFDHRFDIAAHKLVPGQRIRLHNDFIRGGETHRLTIHLGRGWREANGGFLVVFHSTDPADIHKILPPAHNSAFGFAIAPNSHHAVSTLRAGTRFSLVYSFHER